MIAGIQAAEGYEILATANLFVINYSETDQPWKVAKLVSLVKTQIRAVRDIELILNLEELTELSESVVRSIWQITRVVKTLGVSAKCVLPKSRKVPALEAFAVNGLLELYGSVDEIIYEGEPQELCSSLSAYETHVW